MTEYKEADEIIKNMTEKFDKNYGDTTIKGIRDVFNMCVNCINQTPTADVVEVKRGEWIKKFKYSHGYDDYYNTECSLCGYKVEKSGVGDKLSLDNFCPNCGADMRGDGK